MILCLKLINVIIDIQTAIISLITTENITKDQEITQENMIDLGQDLKEKGVIHQVEVEVSKGIEIVAEV